MNDITILLYLNYACIFLNLRLAYISYRRNKLINLIYYLVFLFLVTFQALNITYNLENLPRVFYNNNIITIDGHLMASIVLLYCILVFCFVEILYKKKKIKFIPVKKEIITKKSFSFLYYTVHWGIFLTMMAAMVALVGFSEIVSESRPGASGNTLFLTIISLCVYPLIIKIITNTTIQLQDVLLFAFTFMVIVLFSRQFAIYQVLLLFVAAYYSVYRKYKIPLARYKSYFIGTTFFIVFFFFGYGSWRHLKNYTVTENLSVGELLAYAQKHPEQTLFSIDVNYKVGIEGISGLSGELSDFCENPLIKLDGGVSMLSSLITLIPSFFRGPFTDLLEWIKSAYWYGGSVVGSGLEASFVHFSFLGLIAYPIFLGWYMNTLNKSLSQTGKKSIASLSDYIFVIYGLLIIRGSSSAFAFFLIVNLIMIHVAKFIYFSLNTKRLNSNL